MTKETNHCYWLDQAISSFFDSVWYAGLQKFALDSVGDTAVLEFGDLSIKLSPAAIPNYAILTLSDTNVTITISLALESETIFFQILDCNDIVSGADMIYEIIDSWVQGFFTLKV